MLKCQKYFGFNYMSRFSEELRLFHAPVPEISSQAHGRVFARRGPIIIAATVPYRGSLASAYMMRAAAMALQS